VREHAEERALARLDQLRRYKQSHPRRIIGVTGCMAQKDAERLLDRLPHIDLVLGTRAIARLSPLLDEILATGQPQACVDLLDDAYPEAVAPRREHPFKAFINIMFGCNKHCSYCIVPRTRGREVSRPAGTILAEVDSLARGGYKDITLVGQNVNSYRGAINGKARPAGAVGGPAGAHGAGAQALDFGALLRQVSATAPGVRIRYITSHPRDCNAAHIAAVAECANVCENFHLPVQAGSTAVLRNMYRGYTRERYLELAGQIRAAISGVSLTTDLIVGFPGETDADYEQTLDLVREVRFDAAYMYLYSPRPGTPAAEQFEDHIPLAVKKERLARLIEVQEAISLENNHARIGRTFEVLVEGPAPRTPGDLLGRTRADQMVILPGPADWIGRFKTVRITAANGHTLFATPDGA
jgi:tRNA-2-methylthio-N6-dimethylallyladenosine synthase